jgi:hypothetical protein
MKKIYLLASAICVFCFMPLTELRAQDVDVYLVYSGRARAEKNAIAEALASHLNVTEYNADLLALADYSGKQRVIARMGRARVVVVVSDRAMELVGGGETAAVLVVVGSGSDTFASTSGTSYVVRSETSVSARGTVRSINALSDIMASDAASGGVFTVDSSVGLGEAAAAVVDRILGD